MSITTKKSNIRTIQKHDHDFLISAGAVHAPRAGFQISESCPSSYKMVILECIRNEWLKPVAYALDQELVWDALRSE